MKVESPWEKKWILATHVTCYLQNCIPSSTFPHHFMGLLCRKDNISGWWQIWMLFTHGHTALDHQGGVCRRAAHYHSAATPALQSTGAWRTDTSVSFPVSSHLCHYGRGWKDFECLISLVKGEKNEQTTKPGKTETVSYSSGCFELMHYSGH